MTELRYIISNIYVKSLSPTPRKLSTSYDMRSATANSAVTKVFFGIRPFEIVKTDFVALRNNI